MYQAEKTKKQGNNVKEYGDFGKKWVGKTCRIVFHDGSTVEGKINGNQKYFIEFTDETNRTTYIHKAYIKEIIPEE